MYTQRWDSLTAVGANMVIQQMLNACIAEYRAGHCFDNATEENIVEQFDGLAQTLFDLEQHYNEQSVTLKILDIFITVQVIFLKEESA